jgi:membrane associated rhomboid family serine protease
MTRRSSGIRTAVLFFVFAAVFSVIFWPDVSIAAKLAFFGTGVGCGVGIARAVGRPAETD